MVSIVGWMIVLVQRGPSQDGLYSWLDDCPG